MSEPGWYPDPSNTDLLRWWTGSQWDAATAPSPGRSRDHAGPPADTAPRDCIFISYRRQDSKWPAALIHDRVEQQYGTGRVFFDVTSIVAGYDFTDVIDSYLERTAVMLAVIGRDWLDARDDNGGRRLDRPEDFVRIEIARALQRGIRVVPVLVDGATMPRADDLPAEIAGLARRHAVELDHNNFDSDLERLLRQLAGADAQGSVTGAAVSGTRGAGIDAPRIEDLRGRRIAAFAIDVLVTAGVVFGSYLGIYASRCPDGANACKAEGAYDSALGLGIPVAAGLGVLMLLAYWALPIRLAGGTLFMRAFGIQVLDEAGGRLGFATAFLRSCILVLPTLLYGLGVLYLVTYRDGRSGPDRLTSSVVVRST